jgi:hypothetical protein
MKLEKEINDEYRKKMIGLENLSRPRVDWWRYKRTEYFTAAQMEEDFTIDSGGGVVRYRKGDYLVENAAGMRFGVDKDEFLADFVDVDPEEPYGCEACPYV